MLRIELKRYTPQSQILNLNNIGWDFTFNNALGSNENFQRSSSAIRHFYNAIPTFEGRQHLSWDLHFEQCKLAFLRILAGKMFELFMIGELNKDGWIDDIYSHFHQGFEPDVHDCELNIGDKQYYFEAKAIDCDRTSRFNLRGQLPHFVFLGLNLELLVVLDDEHLRTGNLPEFIEINLRGKYLWCPFNLMDGRIYWNTDYSRPMMDFPVHDQNNKSYFDKFAGAYLRFLEFENEEFGFNRLSIARNNVMGINI